MKKLPPEFKLRYNNRRGDPNYSCYYELLYCEGAQESIIAKYYEDKYETENQIWHHNGV